MTFIEFDDTFKQTLARAREAAMQHDVAATEAALASIRTLLAEHHEMLEQRSMATPYRSLVDAIALVMRSTAMDKPAAPAQVLALTRAALEFADARRACVA